MLVVMRPAHTWLVASHGGHLSEMFDLLDYDPGSMLVVTYISDRASKLRNAVFVHNIGRNPLRFLVTLMKVMVLMSERRPKLVISTGSEIAVPVFIVAYLLRIPRIYVESCTRVRTPTFTARIVYPLSSVFLVQSPELISSFGKKAIYEGGLV